MGPGRIAPVGGGGAGCGAAADGSAGNGESGRRARFAENDDGLADPLQLQLRGDERESDDDTGDDPDDDSADPDGGERAVAAGNSDHANTGNALDVSHEPVLLFRKHADADDAIPALG